MSRFSSDLGGASTAAVSVSLVTRHRRGIVAQEAGHAHV